jgi:hypothetical protein
MNKQTLLELRKEVSDNLLPLVLESEGPAEDRIELVMNMIRMGNADESLYRRAFDTIMTVEDKNQKAAFLFELLSEIESEIEAVESEEQVEPVTSDQPTTQSEEFQQS